MDTPVLSRRRETGVRRVMFLRIESDRDSLGLGRLDWCVWTDSDLSCSKLGGDDYKGVLCL